MKQESGIQSLKGIGEKSAALFHKLGVDELTDLMEYYPRDYEKLEQVQSIDSCRAGVTCAVRAQFTGSFTTRKVRNLTISNGSIADETGKMQVTFFNMPYLQKSLHRGTWYVLRGVVKLNGKQLVMEQPKVYGEEEYRAIEGQMCPRYGLTQGLTNQAVTKAVRQCFEKVGLPDEILPDEILKQYALRGYGESLYQIHFPTNTESLIDARKRLVFQEFLFFLLQIRNWKEQVEELPNENPMLEVADTKRLEEALPYALTNAQKRTWGEIQADLSGSSVMNRLVQGDVGSGKTIVAFLALLMCVGNGYQGALMAPTEVLARQHFEQIKEMTETYHLSFRPVLLTGSVKASAKKEIYRQIAEGEANLIIGTHALIQEKVVYKNLGLVVTDEQHRFGVRQRTALAGKGEGVHVLVMSATPIPRTLAMILYGDLNISVMDELPAERQPIRNCVIPESDREKAYRFLMSEVNMGRQIYIVCPMVEEGELENVENVTDYAKKLREELPDSIRIACLHGKLKPAEKNRIMEEFLAQNYDILVSTTVIEVGVNVPNATVMMIENAERFGLAQLHQLRGRVGRGKWQSYCIFVNASDKPETRERLDILNHSNDGFYIAEQDLKLRGPGDMFGIRQSGIMDFKIGDVFQDAKILQDAGACAAMLMKEREKESEKYVEIWKYLRRKQMQEVDFPTL